MCTEVVRVFVHFAFVSWLCCVWSSVAVLSLACRDSRLMKWSTLCVASNVKFAHTFTSLLSYLLTQYWSAVGCCVNCGTFSQRQLLLLSNDGVAQHIVTLLNEIAVWRFVLVAPNVEKKMYTDPVSRKTSLLCLAIPVTYVNWFGWFLAEILLRK